MNYVSTAEAVMKMANSNVNNDESGIHYWFGMRRTSQQYLLQNFELEPSIDQYDGVLDFIKTNMEIKLNYQQLEELLNLYPTVRIVVADNSPYDSEVRSNISNMISGFFLGCPWPIYSEEINAELFLSVLKKQAGLFGYKTVDVNLYDESVKLIIPDVLSLFEAYYKNKNELTSDIFHIIFDDDNVTDDHVNFCLDAARKIKDFEAIRLSKFLLRMTKTQRLKLGGLLK